jgi:hypothetical protein
VSEFLNKGIKAQRGKVTFPRLHSEEEAELALGPRCLPGSEDGLTTPPEGEPDPAGGG